MSDIQVLRNSLAKYGQEHLLRYWDSLTDMEKEELLLDLNEINLESVLLDFQKNTESIRNKEKLDANLKPVPSSLFGGVDRVSAETLKLYESKGLELVADGKVAVLVLAGGQGTRLGVTYPKGMYDVGLPSRKTLYQLQAERIIKLQELAYAQTGKRAPIPWFVMTSESTMEPTADFFRKHKYFGLEEENIVMFEQYMLPAFTFDGKIILEKKHKIAMSPDGNGGLYRALRDRRILEELQNRGVEYVHAFSVDNILVKIGDPAFVGYCAQQHAECGVKVIEKTVPEEAIGVVCIVNEKWQVVEYSEIPAKIAEKRSDDGKLLFNAGSICNHIFSVDFLDRICTKHVNDIELHVAKKKIPFVDGNGKRVEPKETNGIKMEKFIFDVFPFSKKLVVWECKREEEFSPMKNVDEVGKDCPSTARKGIFQLHKNWIEKAGGVFEPSSSAEKDVICEISPLLTYSGEGLEASVKGHKFSSPLYLKSACDE